MLRSYQRRAFLALAFVGIHSGTAAAQDSLWDVLNRAATAPTETVKPAGTASGTAPGTATPVVTLPATESLWDVMVRADTAPLTLPQVNVIAPATVRRPLGPVPGFTLPAPKRAQEEGSSLFGKGQKRGRGLFGSVGDWFSRWQEATGTKIKFSGHNTFSFRSEQIAGNAEAFRSDQYFGRGNNGFYTDTDLTIEATLFKHFRYETRISNSPFNNPYDPNNNRVKIDYNTDRLKVEWGHINAGFQGNSLIDFNRFLYGVQLRNKWSSNFSTSVLYSQTRAETRTITIPGNNSAGPYYVYAGQIVEGSDRVRVNERELVKGRDYTLDTYTGELQFLGGKIVLQTDAIAVTFETVGFNQQRGNIYGLRAEYTPRGQSRFGITYVTQQAQGSQGPQSRTQQFYGFGAPGAAYLLDAPVDITKPVIVSVAGVPLVQGIDYVIDATLTNQIRIAQAIPVNVIIQVQYFPLNVTPVPGNRNVLGFDGRIGLGRLGFLTTEFALSGLNLTGNNVSGNAYQVRADLMPMRNLTTSITLRNISPTFSSVQSPGFNRNERSFDFNADYAATSNLRFNLNYQKAKRPAYSGGFGLSQFNVTTSGEDDYTQSSFSISNTFGFNMARRARAHTDETEENRLKRLQKGRVGGALTFTRSSLGTQFVTGGDTSNVNDSLALNFGFRNLTFNAAINRNVNRSDAIFDLGTGIGGSTGGPQLFSTRSSTSGTQFGLSWSPFSWLQLSGSHSDNNITATGNDQTNHTTARDTQFTASFKPTRDLRLRYTYQLSDTGNLSNLLIPGGTTGNNGGTDNGGTNNGGSDTLVGTPSRGVFPLLMRTRQAPITAGGSGSSTTGFSPFGSSTFGGGNYANLGGFGNYSGFYGNNFNNGYGVSSFGGRSQSNNIGLDWTLKSNMTLGLQYTNASSIGDYQYNSNRNGLNVNFNWQPSERLQFNFLQGFQNVAYNGGLGGSKTSTTQVSLGGRPFGGKLSMQVSWMSVKTNSNLNFGVLDPTTGGNNGNTQTPTDTSISLNSLSGRLDYPLSNRYTLFAEMLNSSSAGYLGSSENNLRFGLDFALMRNLKFSLGWQIFNRTYSDPQYEQYNYKVSSLLAELGFRF